MGNHGFGKSYPRIEDARLLRGGGRYIDDMVLPRMAQGYVLRSPHAHAKIRAIDATAAMASPMKRGRFSAAQVSDASRFEFRSWNLGVT